MQDAISLAKKESEWTDLATQTKILDLLMKVDPAKANAQVKIFAWGFKALQVRVSRSTQKYVACRGISMA